MARTIPAVGLASALVQTIDFSINTLRKDHTVYQPNDAISTPVENAAFLQDIIHNLYRLVDLINQSELKKLHDATRGDKKAKKLSEPAQQLLRLVDQTKELSQALIDALIAAQAKGSFGDPRWATARDALTNGVWKNGDVKSSKKKFRALRRELDTALLMAMRQFLDQAKESGLPLFSEDEGVKLHHLEAWQKEALDAIQVNDWKSGKKKHVDEFAKQVDKLIVAEQLEHFCEMVFKLLWFEEWDERVNSIPKPMDGALEWVFGEGQRQIGGLLEWLGNVRGEGVFWVTGKPGAGKTTLMKYIFRNPRAFPYLESWSGHAPGIISGFFLLNTGVELQKSMAGLLRSLLYESLQDMIFGPLDQGQAILQWLFADRWNQFTSYGGGLHNFTLAELRKSFELLISDASKRFLFLIDGLDEMVEYPNELIDLILNASKRKHVKFCVSSRASPVFLSAFESRPHLCVDEWTKNEVHTYVTTAFNLEPVLESLRGKMDGQQEVNIVNTLTEKASGVFLWAFLATSFLLHGLIDGDDFLILKDRADALPHHLDDLFAHILDRLDPVDLGHLWMIHVILESHAYPHLLPLSFALTAETHATFVADLRPLKAVETTKRIDDTRALLKYRCKDFFSIFDSSPPGVTSSDASSLRVTYTHRVIRDYLLSHPNIFSTLPPQTFSADEQWANAYLWTLKTLPPPSPTTPQPLPLWTPLYNALERALTIHATTKKFPLTYLEAVLSTAIFQHLKSDPGSDLPHFPASSPTTTLTTPFDLAMLLNIQGYIALKAKTTEKRDLKHGVEFAREMRKRLGKGGEEGWLGGQDKARLKAEYGKGRAETDAWVEYYLKVTRIGVRKPGGVEVPEYV